MTVPISIPQACPLASYEAHKSQIDEAIARVLSGGRYILGRETAAFEEEFAAYLGARHAVGVGSGTEALHLALLTCRIGPGDEVITVSHTAVATVAAIELAGASPVLVDIDPTTYTIDPTKIEQAISTRTRAIIPVHLYGHPADVTPVIEIARRHNLRVIEDCAQSHGATYQDRKTGTMGDMGAFSFYPTKNLGAFGDGGAVVTSDPELAERARMLREYGWRQRYVSDLPGLNTRLDELQAAILRVKLAHLDADNARRRSLAGLYDEYLAATGLQLPLSPRWGEHVYHLYVIRSLHRNELQAYLTEHGIGSLVHYPVPVHLQPAYRDRLRLGGPLRETEVAAAEVLSLPIYPELSDAQVRIVAEAIRAFFGAADGA